MNFLVRTLLLTLALSTFANANEGKDAVRKVASVEKARQAAEQMVKTLYGKTGDRIRTEVTGTNTFVVNVGDGGAAKGSAMFVVEFKKLNLTGASDNEQVVDMQITSMGRN